MASSARFEIVLKQQTKYPRQKDMKITKISNPKLLYITWLKGKESTINLT